MGNYKYWGVTQLCRGEEKITIEREPNEHSGLRAILGLMVNATKNGNRGEFDILDEIFKYVSEEVSIESKKFVEDCYETICLGNHCTLSEDEKGYLAYGLEMLEKLNQKTYTS